MFHKAENIPDKNGLDVDDKIKFNELLAKLSNLKKGLADIQSAIRLNVEESSSIKNKIFLIHDIDPDPNIPECSRDNIIFKKWDYKKNHYTSEETAQLKEYEQVLPLLKKKLEELYASKRANLSEREEINLELQKIGARNMEQQLQPDI